MTTPASKLLQPITVGPLEPVSYTHLDVYKRQGEKWEIGCAREEGKKVLGIWAYSDDRTDLPGVRTVSWTWSHIEDLIDSL